MASVPDLRLEPRAIPVRNAWYLLLYAWDLVRWKSQWLGQSEAAPELLGLLARVLSDGTTSLIRRHLGRSFDQGKGEIRGVRGKVDFSASTKRLSFERGRPFCHFPELTIDTLRNRIIRSTLNRLAHDPRIRAGGGRAEGERLRYDLMVAVRAMDGVSLIEVQGADFAKLQLGRSDQAYRLPLAICELVYRLQMPEETSGDAPMVGLLRDELAFARLFEKFVRNFFRVHLPDCVVKSEQLNWPDELGSAYAPVMLTDTTIETRRGVRRRLVIDTKYYAQHLNQRYEGVGKVHARNLYQMYAYLRTQEGRGEQFGSAEGALLYPSTGGYFAETMLVQGHRIHVRTLDLSASWQTIERDLLDLARESLALAAE